MRNSSTRNWSICPAVFRRADSPPDVRFRGGKIERMKSFRVSHLDFWFALLLFLPLLLAGEKSAKGQQVFSIDPKNSFVTIHVDKTGLFSFAAHTHEVVASPVRGQVIFDPNQPANSSVWVEFDAQTLTVTGKGEPSEDVPEVQRTM